MSSCATGIIIFESIHTSNLNMSSVIGWNHSMRLSTELQRLVIIVKQRGFLAPMVAIFGGWSTVKWKSAPDQPWDPPPSRDCVTTHLMELSLSTSTLAGAYIEIGLICAISCLLISLSIRNSLFTVKYKFLYPFGWCASDFNSSWVIFYFKCQ